MVANNSWEKRKCIGMSKKKRKAKRTNCCVFLLLALLAGGMGWSLKSYMQKNQYSRPIVVESNYFMKYRDEALKNNLDNPDNAVGEIWGVDEAGRYGQYGEGDSVYKMDVPVLLQKEEGLPNGCEAVSAAMLLKYAGININVQDFVIEDLPKDRVYVQNGCKYGPNPMEKYAGDPFSEKGGYGCFAPVIVEALSKEISRQRVKNLTGISLRALEETYVRQGIPVAIWVTIDMEPCEQYYQWLSYDGDETLLYPMNEHCVVITGCDEENYFLNDPNDSDGEETYSKEKINTVYCELGMQAVAILPE